MNATLIPRHALSVRQPWAWAIIHAGKPVENRSTGALRHMSLPRRLAIHASKGMTRAEYESAAEFMASIGVGCPPAADLLRGGIIGHVLVEGVVKESPSPWFFGPRAILLADPRPCDFIPAVGHLGIFEWRPADPSIIPPPARWMLQEARAAEQEGALL
jgi:hypothetical protein